MLRGTDLTRLMVTLGVAFVFRELANQNGWLTGGADGLQGVIMQPIFGLFRFDMFGHNAYVYCLVVLFILFLLARRIVNSPFGLSLQCDQEQSAARVAPSASTCNCRLVAIYTIAAGYAGIAGALLSQTQAFASLGLFRFRALGRFAAGAHHRRHWLSLWRVDRCLRVQVHAGLSRRADPAILAFWIGLLLVVIVMIGRERITSWTLPFRKLADKLDWRRYRKDGA